MSSRTRSVGIGSVTVGAGAPVVVQSMCSTRTRDIDATVSQANDLHRAGAGVVRVAVDSETDAAALAEIRRQTKVALSVDLQENYRLAASVARHADKIRYNPGHLHHHETEKSVQDKVSFIIDAAMEHGCALRIGVNCGSVDPETAKKHPGDSVRSMVESAAVHCDMLDRAGFTRYVVSLKDSDPAKVIAANRQFSALHPDVPLHLGVTEAGLPPGGIIKTRMAFEPLLADGIGDTIRVSLTVPSGKKVMEVKEGLKIIEDVRNGRFTPADRGVEGLNIVSCPSCSRVENEAFVELAEQVREITAHAKPCRITIAIMGCRVNGPGETDDADLGLWCGPAAVNLKRGTRKLGTFGYGEVLGRVKRELDAIIEERSTEG